MARRRTRARHTPSRAPLTGGALASHARYRTRRGEQAAIQIEGLSEFLRDIGTADRQLRVEFNRLLRAAADPIVADARRFYYGGHNLGYGFAGYRRRTGRSVEGIRSETHFGGVAVVLAGSRKRFRHLPAQEWGSYVLPQFGPPRGKWHSADAEPGDSGSFFWPAYRLGLDQLTDDVADALDTAVATIAGANRGAGRLAGALNLHGAGAAGVGGFGRAA